MSAPFRIELLTDQHDRKGFSCGQEALDRYFQTQVSQDMRRRVANCFVAIENGTETIAAFYTIASAGIAMTDLPPEITKRLPRYPSIPAVRIGRLAVSLSFRGKGLGSAMLADAIRKVLGAAPAAFALLVDAKDEKAVAFYLRHGFQQLSSQPMTLFLSVATAAKLGA